MDKAVFAIARNEDQAIRIANQLKAAGFSGNDISVLLPDKAGSRDFAHEQHTKAPEGAAAGAGAGAVLGGALGWIVGIGALAIPGVDPSSHFELPLPAPLRRQRAHGLAYAHEQLGGNFH